MLKYLHVSNGDKTQIPVPLLYDFPQLHLKKERLPFYEHLSFMRSPLDYDSRLFHEPAEV